MQKKGGVHFDLLLGIEGAGRSQQQRKIASTARTHPRNLNTTHEAQRTLLASPAHVGRERRVLGPPQEDDEAQSGGRTPHVGVRGHRPLRFRPQRRPGADTLHSVLTLGSGREEVNLFLSDDKPRPLFSKWFAFFPVFSGCDKTDLHAPVNQAVGACFLPSFSSLQNPSQETGFSSRFKQIPNFPTKESSPDTPGTEAIARLKHQAPRRRASFCTSASHDWLCWFPPAGRGSPVRRGRRSRGATRQGGRHGASRLRPRASPRQQRRHGQRRPHHRKLPHSVSHVVPWRIGAN